MPVNVEILELKGALCEADLFAIAQRQALPDRISRDLGYAIMLKQIYVIAMAIQYA